ncbi:MAG: hypothetical protein OEM02_10515 [Desulfobulbaceae bacterium]|nr:hypothetical protein [Desulfobulbaceae bacterium]
MLTHYHFILLLAVCGGMAAFQLLFERRYFELFMFASSIVLAGLFFVVVHPTFFLSFQRQVLQSQVFDWVEIPARLRLVLHTMLEVFIPHRIVSPLVINASHFCLLVLTVVLTGMAVFLYHAKGLNLGGLARKLIRPKSIPFVASITCFLFIVLLYVSFRSPRHAMGAKYLMIVTPLFFIALGQIIAALNSIRHTMAVVIVVVLLISQITYGTMVTVQSLERVWQPHVNPLRGRDAILVLDSTARGVLPTVLWHADPELSVFASEQKFLLADGFPVLPAHRVVLYVSDIRYQNSKTGREALLHTFSNLGYEVSKLSETYFFHYSEAYVMVP